MRLQDVAVVAPLAAALVTFGGSRSLQKVSQVVQGLVEACLAQVVAETTVQLWPQGFLRGLDGVGNFAKARQMGSWIPVPVFMVGDDPETFFQKLDELLKFHGFRMGILGREVRKGRERQGRVCS